MNSALRPRNRFGLATLGLLLLLPAALFAATTIEPTPAPEPANKDCTTVDACFEVGGCRNVFGGSRFYVKANKKGCVQGGTKCSDITCTIREYIGKNCPRDEEPEEASSPSRACN